MVKLQERLGKVVFLLGSQNKTRLLHTKRERKDQWDSCARQCSVLQAWHWAQETAPQGPLSNPFYHSEGGADICSGYGFPVTAHHASARNTICGFTDQLNPHRGISYNIASVQVLHFTAKEARQ